MYKKFDGEKFTFLPKEISKNQMSCDCCGGVGYIFHGTSERKGYIEPCPKCYMMGYIRLCEYCGRPMIIGMCHNPECMKVEKRENEIRLREMATHYTMGTAPKEYIKYLYSNIYPYNNGYFDDIDELEAYCRDKNIEMPLYVWGTYEVEFDLDADTIVEQALEESYEGAMNNVDEVELEKLQEACDDFGKAHNGLLNSYCVNYSVCIDI